MVGFIEKKITKTDKDFGLIVINGGDKEIVRDFRDYLGGEPFPLKMNDSIFKNMHFVNDEKDENLVRIACGRDFYKGREVGDIIYLRIIKNEKTIEVTDEKPEGIEQIVVDKKPVGIKKRISRSDKKFYVLFISGTENIKIAKEFKNSLSKEFALEIFGNIFKPVHFSSGSQQIRLLCRDVKEFIDDRKIGEIIYLQLKDENTLLVTEFVTDKNRKPDGIEQNKQEF
ncbi:MAG: hypothetical protein LBG80_12500 [Bacteroidales bacterium]|jgi:hypothetical protein|nr:hypothetical protein [Bacteroidales bacterium]